MVQLVLVEPTKKNMGREKKNRNGLQAEASD